MFVKPKPEASFGARRELRAIPSVPDVLGQTWPPSVNPSSRAAYPSRRRCGARCAGAAHRSGDALDSCVSSCINTLCASLVKRRDDLAIQFLAVGLASELMPSLSLSVFQAVLRYREPASQQMLRIYTSVATLSRKANPCMKRRRGACWKGIPAI